MGDVFGGLAGTPNGDGGAMLDALGDVLAGAALWGMELDPKFRVLAVTFEPTVERYAWGDAEDRRIQVLCFPVSTILASLRRDAVDTTEVLAFEEGQLVDVVAALDGPPVTTPVFGRPEPRPGAWGPRFSMEGRATAGDGVRNTLLVEARNDDLAFDVFARFDDVEVKDAAGSPLTLPSA